MKNAAWAFMGEGISRVSKLIVTLLVVRAFGPTDFGRFAFAFAVATLLSIAFDAGMVTVVTREYAKNPAKIASLADMLGLKVVLGAVVMAIGVGIAFIVTADRTVTYMIVILAASLFAGEVVNLGFAVIRARQRMQDETIVRGNSGVMLLFVILPMLWAGATIANVADGYLIAGIGSVLLVAYPLIRNLHWRPAIHFRPHTWWPVLRVALPLALAGGATTLYVNVDAAMLGFYGRITEAGWYGATVRINGVLVVPMSIMGLVLFPALSQIVDDRAAFRRRWSLWVKVSAGIGIVLTVAILITADLLVRLAFGADFAPAANVLRVTVLGYGLMYAYFPWMQALVIRNRQMTLLYIVGGAAILNAILNAALIPLFGMYGAAWATVVTHGVIFVALLLAGRDTK